LAGSLIMKEKAFLILDIGTDIIKLVETSLNAGKLNIKNYSTIKLPMNEPINNINLLELITNEIKNKQISAKNAILCISNQKLEINTIALPEMAHSDLGDSISWQIGDSFSILPEHAVFDYKIIPNEELSKVNKMAVLVAVLPKNIVSEYTNLLQSLKLTPHAFVIEPEASFNIVKNLPKFKDKKTIALLNLGASKTVMSIFKEGELSLMRNMSVSGNKLTSSIYNKVKTTDGSKLSLEDAENIKCKYGITEVEGEIEEKINTHDIFASIRPQLEDLVLEISHFIQYYKSEQNGKDIEAIAFYGGGANFKGLKEYISKNIEIPVFVPEEDNLKILISTEKGADIELSKNILTLFSVLGASFIPSVKNILNLVPKEIKEKEELKKEKSFWMMSWGIFFAIVIVIYLGISFTNLPNRMILKQLNKKYKNHMSLRENLDSYKNNINVYNSKTELCKKLLSTEPFWEDVFKELANIVPKNIIFTEFSFGSQKGKDTTFKISGIVYPKSELPEEEMAVFLKDLEKLIYFHRVKLNYSKEVEEDGSKILEFEINCELKV